MLIEENGKYANIHPGFNNPDNPQTTMLTGKILYENNIKKVYDQKNTFTDVVFFLANYNIYISSLNYRKQLLEKALSFYSLTIPKDYILSLENASEHKEIDFEILNLIKKKTKLDQQFYKFLRWYEEKYNECLFSKKIVRAYYEYRKSGGMV